MRILTICYEYPPIGGGGAPACAGLCEALVKKGHEVDVVTSRMKGLAPIEECDGVLVHRVWCARSKAHYTTCAELMTQVPTSYFKVKQLAREKQYDIVHCHFIVPSGLTALMVSDTVGLPYVLTAHGSDVPGYNSDRFQLTHRVIRPVWNRIIKASSGVTAPSRYLAELLGSYGATVSAVIPNGYDSPKIEDANRKDLILAAARLVKRKGIHNLIKAFSALESNWELVIAGDGPELVALRRLADDLDTRVNFLGHISRGELAKLYAAAKIFVLPSTTENFPMTLLEAMSAGCAVITTTAPGCTEVVGDAAIRVVPDSVDALQGALVSLMRTDAAIERLRQLGMDRASQFSFSRVALQFEEFFQSAVAR